MNVSFFSLAVQGPEGPVGPRGTRGLQVKKTQRNYTNNNTWFPGIQSSEITSYHNCHGIFESLSSRHPKSIFLNSKINKNLEEWSRQINHPYNSFSLKDHCKYNSTKPKITHFPFSILTISLSHNFTHFTEVHGNTLVSFCPNTLRLKAMRLSPS